MTSMASRGSRSTQASKPQPRKMSMSTHDETYDLPQDSLAESLAATNAVIGYSYDGERWLHGVARAQPHFACHLFLLVIWYCLLFLFSPNIHCPRPHTATTNMPPSRRQHAGHGEGARGTFSAAVT